MNSKEIFSLALNLQPPWFIKDIILEKGESNLFGRLTIQIDFEKGARFTMADGQEYSAYDTETKTWQHLGEVRGSPGSSEKFSRFYETMVSMGYSPRPVLLGQSRGALMLLGWAMRNPDKVKAFAGIYPVCNLGSWPLKNSLEAVCKTK